MIEKSTITIEFKLPSGAGGMAAGYRAAALRRRMAEWCEQYGKTADWRAERPYIFCVTFECEQDLTLFALTWPTGSKDAWSSWDKWTRVQGPQ